MSIDNGDENKLVCKVDVKVIHIENESTDDILHLRRQT